MRGRTARFMAAFQALLLLATLVIPALAAATEITTDLWVYQDGDTVTVTGVDFGPNEVVDFVSTDPDGVVVDTGSASSDESGGVVYAFVLNATQGGIYDVVATGELSGLSATTQFDPVNKCVDVTSAVFAWKIGAFTLNLAGTLKSNGGCVTSTTVLVEVRTSDGATNTATGTIVATGNATISGLTWTRSFSFASGSPADGIYDIKASGSVGANSCSGNIDYCGYQDDYVGVDNNAPTAFLSVTSGTLGTGGWYTSNVTIHTTGSDLSGPSDTLTCTADQSQTSETTGVTLNGSCTDRAGRVGTAAPLTIKLDKTAPASTLSIAAGTVGANGWRTSDVTVHTAGVDAISGVASCSADQVQTAETAGQVFNGSCTNGAGLSSNATPLTVKLDKTAPSAGLAVTGGTLGSNGWYTSNVTVAATGTDSISAPVVCAPASQSVSTETTGVTLNSTCTNNAGLATGATPLTIKLDKTGPIVSLAVTAGTLGTGGWYTSDVTVHTSGTEGISVPVSGCTADQFQTANTSGVTFNGSCVDDAGLTGNAAALTIKLDKLAPTSAVVSATGSASGASASGTASDAGPSGLNNGTPKPLHVEIRTGSCAGTPFAGSGQDVNAPGGNWSYTAPAFPSAAGTYFIVSTATDMAGNVQSVDGCKSYTIASADSTPPVITKIITGTAGGSGWYRSNVSVAWTVTDPESAVVIDSGCGTQNFTSETASTASGCTAHSVGGSASDSVTVKIDKTAPIISSSAIANALPYTAGTWTRFDVSVSFNCADTGAVQSLIATNTVATDNATISTEGSAQSVSSDGACVDTAGNADTSETFSPIKVDKTKPVITATASKADASAYVAGTWTNQSVTVGFTCADALSLNASNTVGGGGTENGDTAVGSFTNSGSCTDNAGNTADPVTFSPIKVDKTKPVIVDEGPTSDPNGNNWYDHAVDNEFSVTDALSGINASCDTAFGEPIDFQTKTTSAEGAAVHVTSDGCTDNAGNSASGVDSADFMVALSGPTITDDGPTTVANIAGWYKTDVTNTFSVTPGAAPLTPACLADFAAHTQTQTTTGEGFFVHVTSDGCSDMAGFSAAGIDSADFKIDKTAPVISSSAANADASPYVAGTWTNQSVTVSFTCADTGAVQSTIDLDTVATDNQTLTAETASSNVSSDGACVDKAGNSDSSETFGPVKIDKTAPIISSSAIANALPYTAGTWTRYDVSVSFTCAEAGAVQSGLAANDVNLDNQTLTAETAGTNVSSNGDCIDAAGNADSSETFGPVKIDKTAPVISSSALNTDLSSYVAGTWTNQSVTVSFSCAEAGGVQSGIVTNSVNLDNQTLTGETSGTDVASDGDCVDAAGNSDSAEDFGLVKIDKTAPVISGVATPSANVNGWNNTDVAVTFTCADTGSVLSGITTNTVALDNQTLTAETTGTTVSSDGACVDAAGNSDAAASVGPIKIDKTAPIISSSAANADMSPYVAGTWTNQSVTVSFTCAEAGAVQSGLAANDVNLDNQTLTAETAGTNVSSNGDCIDAAGNADSSETFGPVQIDKTAPVIAGLATPAANANGWNNTNVDVTFTCADTGLVQSGIVTNTVSGDNQTLTAETTGTTVSSNGDCIDAAGNFDASASVGPIKIDKTAPIITGVATPAANANGWNKTSVSVTFTCADTGAVQSTIDADTVALDNQNLTAETTGTTVTSDGSCVDKAGNADTFASVGPIKIDLTNPTVSITSPSTGLITVASAVTVSGSDGDTPSGIDTVSVNGVASALGSGTFTSLNVPLVCGTNTLTAAATDKAGRTGTNSITVTRVCIGSLTYYQPLDQSTGATPIINTGKFGRVIPVKVTGTLSISGSPVVMTDSLLAANGLSLRIGVNGATCANGASTDAVEAFADAGSSNDGTNIFRWSSSQWIYNLDTGKAPSVVMAIGSCYRLDVYLRDAGGTQVRISTGPGAGLNSYAIFQPTK